MNIQRQEIRLSGETEYIEETVTGPEKAAVALVVTYATLALVVSAWSGLILVTGLSESGGPLGHMMNFLLKNGIL
jgi:hypothetical protein